MSFIARNFLLAFDFDLPVSSGTKGNILYIHSSRPEQSAVSLSRLAELYPDKELSLIKNEGFRFCEGKQIKTYTFKEACLPPDFQSPNWATPPKFGMVFFCVNMNIDLVLKKQKPDNEAEDVEYELVEEKLKERYGNILDFLENAHLKEVAYVIDKRYKVWKLTHCDIESLSVKWDVGEETLFLPMTLLSVTERKELFFLGRSGPAEGAIINIGNFLGGSSILMARGSKNENREKVYSFDPKFVSLRENYLKENQVDDWVIFSRQSSENGAQNWGKREDKRIRLLFIDGDHSYEECKKDISIWSPFLVPGGVIALHDYSVADHQGDIYDVTRAVYDTILCSEEFEDFRQKDYLFLAAKKK